jgi:ribosomal protein L37E
MQKEVKNNDVYWSKDEQKTRGYGYVIDDTHVGLIRCPECGRENYMMNVTSGQCTWCPFNANG